MNYVAIFFAGMFLCNCIPHLTSGLQGKPFPTPFARPRGIGNSPPLVNVLWGSLNLFLGSYLLFRHSESIGIGVGLMVLAFGFLVMGVYLALHFGRVINSK
jgi:hypothetical protein